MQECTISINIEIPEPLHEALGRFLEKRPNWDQDRAVRAALAMFLLQSRLPEEIDILTGLKPR